MVIENSSKKIKLSFRTLHDCSNLCNINLCIGFTWSPKLKRCVVWKTFTKQPIHVVTSLDNTQPIWLKGGTHGSSKFDFNMPLHLAYFCDKALQSYSVSVHYFHNIQIYTNFILSSERLFAETSVVLSASVIRVIGSVM